MDAAKATQQEMMISSPRSKLLLLLAVIIAALLLFPYLSTVPGLHGDEAWVGIRADQILHGAKPILGMNGYTGAIHQYLVAPLFYFFGYTAGVLRLITAMATLLVCFLYYALAKRLFAERVAVLAVLVLVSFPFFISYGRIANEVFALNPLLASGAILLLLRSGEFTGWKQILFAGLGGLCLGLGLWNHIVFLSVVVALLATALVAKGLSLLKDKRLYVVTGGLGIALLPRIIWQFTAAAPGGSFAGFDFSSIYDGLGRRLWEWPYLFLQLIHGDLLFRRFAGEVPVQSLSIVWPFLFVGIGLLVRKACVTGEKGKSKATSVLVFTVVLFFSTLLLCPANSDRYFLLPLYAVPLFVAVAFDALLRLERFKPFVVLFIAAFMVFQLSRITFDYFGPQLKLHGLNSKYLLGQQEETSNHYIRTDELYHRLVQRGAKRVYAEFFIALPLQFYDLKPKALTVVRVVNGTGDLADALRADDNATDGTYGIVYAEGGVRRIGPGEYVGFKPLFADSGFQWLQPEAASNTHDTK